MKTKDEIAAELKALQADLGVPDAGTPGFHIPEGYFQDFPASMTSLVKAMNSDVTLEVPVSKDGPFEVPLGYFTQLSKKILARISAMDAVVNSGDTPWPNSARQDTYTVPEGYFETLPGYILDRVQAEAETPETLSPLLEELRARQPYSVPEGYFQAEPLARKARVAETVRSLEHPAVRSIKWARWAAAAAVVAIFSLGGLHFFDNPAAAPVATASSFQQALAKVPEANLKEWLSNNLDDSDVYLMASSLRNTNKIHTKASLNSFTDKEIQDILDTETW